MDEKWKKSDLKVIAFVNNYDLGDVDNNRIDNVECCSVSGEMNSVDGVEAADVVSVEYYDLAGCPVAADSKGFVVKVTRCSDGTVRSSKELNP